MKTQFILLFSLLISSQAYSTSLALQLGYMSAASYQSSSSVKAWTCSHCKKYKLQKVSTFSTSDSVFGFTGFSRDLNAIIVAFRGSKDINNWIKNLQVAFTGYPECSGCSIHQGFYSSYKGVSSSVKSQITSLKALFRNSSIYLTGHSLGGALASICAIDVTKHIASVNKVYTFGEPRVGNPNLASYFSSKLTVYRVVNYADIVPHLPQTTFGYKHEGHEVWYTPRGMKSYKQCSTSEDQHCSNSLLPTEWNTDDHDLEKYLKLKVGEYNSEWISNFIHPFKRHIKTNEQFGQLQLEAVNRIREQIKEEEEREVKQQ